MVKSILSAVCDCLSAAKAERVVVIDLPEGSVADYFVVAEGTSARHVSSLAGRLVEVMKGDYGLVGLVEGEDICDWVLIDLGDVVVHLFRPEVRVFYDLEKLWETENKEKRKRPAVKRREAKPLKA